MQQQKINMHHVPTKTKTHTHTAREREKREESTTMQNMISARKEARPNRQNKQFHNNKCIAAFFLLMKFIFFFKEKIT